MAGNLRKSDVFDRVAERPVADVVQQRGGEQQFGIVRRNGGSKPLVGRQPVEVFDRREENAERMFLPRVVSARVDEPDQAKLADVSETAKRGRVDELSYAASEWHVDARWNPHATGRGAPAADFGDVVDASHVFYVN